MPARRVLFTGGGGAASEAWCRLLGTSWEPHFCDANPDAQPAGVPSSRWHAIPMAHAEGFITAISALCQRLDVELLVPGVDEELEVVAAGRDLLPCQVLLPPTAFVTRHLDKLASMTWLSDVGLDVPATTPASASSTTWPCIVKPRRGRGSRQVAVATSHQHLHSLVEASGRALTDFILQPRLDGVEYTVTAVGDARRRLRAVIPVRVDLKRGITLRAVTEGSEAIVAYVRALHEADPVAGVYNVQLVHTARGPQAFEVNPRVSTTTCLAVASGVPVLDLCLDDTDETLGLAPFVEGLRLRRSWINEFSRD